MSTMTVAEAAEVVNAHPASLRRLIRAGELKATPKGLGPRSGYEIRSEDLIAFMRERGLRRKPVNAASFRESAPLFGDEGTFPTPSLPPLGGTTADLIAYGERLTALAKAALGEARRRIERGNDGGET